MMVPNFVGRTGETVSVIASILRLGCSLMNHSICSSFSSGASVQVEYTSVPPGLSMRKALRSRRRWSFACSVMFFCDQKVKERGSLRSIRPSAVQGTSARIASNASGNSW
jgi:hypothetical protein